MTAPPVRIPPVDDAPFARSAWRDIIAHEAPGAEGGAWGLS